MKQIRTVFFDLDGTLLDTAPDMSFTLNALCRRYGIPELPFQKIRPVVSHGAKALVKLAFNFDNGDSEIQKKVDEFLSLYEEHATSATNLFMGMENVLTFLESKNIPWGVVTNKPARFTFDILKALDLEDRAACIVCGDTLPKRKPDPDPLLHACSLLQEQPGDCVYIGDSQVDVISAKSAGMPVLLALYGYIGKTDDPYSWNASGYLRQASDIIPWLQANLVNAGIS